MAAAAAANLHCLHGRLQNLRLLGQRHLSLLVACYTAALIADSICSCVATDISGTPRVLYRTFRQAASNRGSERGSGGLRTRGNRSTTLR